MMGVAPAARSGSACRIERKVSEPSKPRPDRKAPMTGMTESSRPSQWTKPCRYCSLKRLRKTPRLHLLMSPWVNLHFNQNRITDPTSYAKLEGGSAALRTQNQMFGFSNFCPKTPGENNTLFLIPSVSLANGLMQFLSREFCLRFEDLVWNN